MFSLICARINGWVNNREAGDLRRYRAHYDVTVMNFHRVPNSAFTPLGPILLTAINTLRPGQNYCHFADESFKCICLNKNVRILIKYHWSLFLRVQLTISQHWFRQWLGTDKATSHYLNQWWLDYWRIYASLGPNELTEFRAWISNYNHGFHWDLITKTVFTCLFNPCGADIGIFPFRSKSIPCGFSSPRFLYHL